MTLRLAHPELAFRTCEVCQQWVFDRDGNLARDRHGDFIPMGRRRPPCYSCPKCQGMRQASPAVGRQMDLSPRNQLTLRRYYEHQAGGGPTDDLMQHNFGIIAETLDTFDRATARAMLAVKGI